MDRCGGEVPSGKPITQHDPNASTILRTGASDVGLRMARSERRRSTRWVLHHERRRPRCGPGLGAPGRAGVQPTSGRDRGGALLGRPICSDRLGSAVTRYDRLLLCMPSPVVARNRTIALGETQGPGAGLAALDAIARARSLSPAACRLRPPAAPAVTIRRQARLRTRRSPSGDNSRAAVSAATDRGAGPGAPSLSHSCTD